MYGAMKRVLEMTVEYAQQRVQFGRPIGSFQAVQHLCVQMLEAVEGSEHITHEAAWLLSSGHPADREVAMAASWVAEALGVVAQNGHQVHGAIGFTLEHDMQLYSRKMRIAEGILGDPARRARQVLARAS
jgi:alkylation response protein AidB-like acyl-CoA dehydrogenase